MRCLAAFNACLNLMGIGSPKHFASYTLVGLSLSSTLCYAQNVIPGTIEILFNFRFSTEQTESSLRQYVENLLDKHDLQYTLDWTLSGQPFLTATGDLVSASVAAIQTVKGIETELSTSGGTSDGRFIAPTGAQVMELGPVNRTIHKINECVSVDDLETLRIIYQKILEHLLLPSTDKPSVLP